MPDLERPLRELEIELVKDPFKRELIRQYHRGIDRGRFESVIIVSFIVFIIIAVNFLG